MAPFPFLIPAKRLILIVCLLALAAPAACSAPRPAAPGDQQPGERQATPPVGSTPVEPTPIPNPRAEAVLNQSFGSFIEYLRTDELTITPQELENRQQGESLFLADLRNPLEAKKSGHIPGAVLIPMRELGRKTSLLPDFSVPLVFYCKDTPECLIALVGMGVYGWDVRVLDGGFAGWVSAGKTVNHAPIPIPVPDPFKPAFPCCGIYEQSAEQDQIIVDPNAPHPSLVAATERMFSKIPGDFGAITAEELAQELQQNPALLAIDLRPEGGDELPAKLIHIPFAQLIEARHLWPADKTTPLVVYCQDGRLSPLALAVLWSYGYTNVRELRGGLAAWKGLAGSN